MWWSVCDLSAITPVTTISTWPATPKHHRHLHLIQHHCNLVQHHCHLLQHYLHQHDNQYRQKPGQRRKFFSIGRVRDVINLFDIIQRKLCKTTNNTKYRSALETAVVCGLRSSCLSPNCFTVKRTKTPSRFVPLPFQYQFPISTVLHHSTSSGQP